MSWGPGLIWSHWDGLHKLAVVWKGYITKKINLKWLGNWKYPEGSCDTHILVNTEIVVIFWLAQF